MIERSRSRVIFFCISLSLTHFSPQPFDINFKLIGSIDLFIIFKNWAEKSMDSHVWSKDMDRDTWSIQTRDVPDYSNHTYPGVFSPIQI